jgi:hypothetical protein
VSEVRGFTAFPFSGMRGEVVWLVGTNQGRTESKQLAPDSSCVPNSIVSYEGESVNRSQMEVKQL